MTAVTTEVIAITATETATQKPPHQPQAKRIKPRLGHPWAWVTHGF